MEAEDCPFSRLPLEFRDFFLLQTFQHLGVQQQLRVLPLVCKDFHQLGPDATNSFSIAIRSNEGARMFASWMFQHRPASLHGVTIKFKGGPEAGSTLDSSGAEQVLCAVTRLPALQELSIYGWEGGERLELECTSVSVPGQLWSLEFFDCIIMPSMASMITQFTGLTSLVLMQSDVKS